MLFLVVQIGNGVKPWLNNERRYHFMNEFFFQYVVCFGFQLVRECVESLPLLCIIVEYVEYLLLNEFAKMIQGNFLSFVLDQSLVLVLLQSLQSCDLLLAVLALQMILENLPD